MFEAILSFVPKTPSSLRRWRTIGSPSLPTSSPRARRPNAATPAEGYVVACAVPAGRRLATNRSTRPNHRSLAGPGDDMSCAVVTPPKSKPAAQCVDAPRAAETIRESTIEGSRRSRRICSNIPSANRSLHRSSLAETCPTGKIRLRWAKIRADTPHHSSAATGCLSRGATSEMRQRRPTTPRPQFVPY